MHDRIKEIGTRLLDLAREEEKKIVKSHWWENAFLDWCMQNQELKTRTFQFIDIFPQLTSSHSVLKHIREYFPGSEHRIPPAIRAGLLLTHPSLLTQGMVHQLTRVMFVKIAKLFIAATNENEATELIRELDGHAVRCSMDLLGERTMSEEEAEGYFKRYQALIQEIGTMKLGLEKQNVSVKLSALDPCFDPINPEKTSLRVRARFRELVRLAVQNDVFVHVDMEEYPVRDLTLKIVRDLLSEEEFRQGVPMGIVLQAYLKDAEPCLEGILDWAGKLKSPLTIRLVRGAYWDQEIMKAQELNWPVPVFTEKSGTDGMFEKLAEKILDQSPQIRLATATHNIRSIAHTIACAESRNLDKSEYEFQLLYGMGTPLMNALCQLGYSPRMYVPVGDYVWGMAYLVRRLLENVSSQSFVRRGIHEHTDVEQLLRHPEEKAAGVIARSDESFEYIETPPLQFFKSDVRERFTQALKSAAGQLDQEVPLVIDGRPRYTKKKIKTFSPSDKRITIARSSCANLEDTEEAIQAAGQALPGWSSLPVSKRAEHLRKAARWMEKNRYDLAALEVYEVGKPYREADADIKEAIDFLNFYAYAAEKIQKEGITEAFPHEVNLLSPQARGIAAVIAPWNFPVAILTGMSAAALVTGNPVILKPAEQSLLSGWQVFRAYDEAGIPEGVVNFLAGYGQEIGPKLVEDPRVAVVVFTGSREVGTQIAEKSNLKTAGQKHLKKFIIEMGGKNAAIVDETADFDQTIPAVLHSAFTYAGQKCSALSRLIVLDSVYEAFTKRLVAAAKVFPFGDPLEPETMCGPVIDSGSAERIRKIVQEGSSQGRVLFEAVLPELRGGQYVPPVIFDELPPDSRLLTEEIFGPVLTVIRAKHFKEALRIANDSPFGLTGGLFSRTPSHIERTKKAFEVGNLYINRAITGAVVRRQPFGGYKMSGTGTKAGSMEYLREFFYERTISENRSRHGFAP